MTKNDLPTFDSPPLAEVVFGVSWREQIEAALIGRFWAMIKDEFPIVRELNPLAHIVETYDNPEILQTITGRFQTPRSWLIQEDDCALVQIQSDRLLYNWKSLGADNEYPRFAIVFRRFQEILSKFRDSIEEARKTRLDYNQYELTYVNHLPQGELWRSVTDISNIFPDISWRNSHAFLSEPVSLVWTVAYDMPNRSGRLHVNLTTAFKRETKEQILRLDLTARGFPSEKSQETMDDWFDTAHKWIVNAFMDLTGADVQRRVWKRRDTHA